MGVALCFVGVVLACCGRGRATERVRCTLRMEPVVGVVCAIWAWLHVCGRGFCLQWAGPGRRTPAPTLGGWGGVGRGRAGGLRRKPMMGVVL